MVKVFVIDDHDEARQALVSKLQKAAGLQIVGHTGDSREAVALASLMEPDVVLLDVKMRNGRGLELCRRIANDLPDTKIIVLTSYLDEREWSKYYLAGARAFLLKDLNISPLMRLMQQLGMA